MQEGRCLIDYHNAVLYPRDLSFFQDSNWLNDNCINFVFRWYQHNLRRSEGNSLPLLHLPCSVDSLSSCSVSPILFMDPSVVSHLRSQRLDEDDLQDLRRGLQLSRYKYLFIPCNDQSSFASASTHWSLLVVDLTSQQVYSFDSSEPHNSQTMSYLTQILCGSLLAW
jgi:Ulp1 family protease